MNRVYLSLGTNIDRYRHITVALNALSLAFGKVVCSPVYESEAVGFDGAHFLNMVVLIETALSCGELNLWLKQLEDSHGRKRDVKKFSPRTLDIDILLLNAEVGTIDGVTLPRAEINFNAFVLRPLADISPEVIHPETGLSFLAMWQSFDQSTQQLWPVPFNWTPPTAAIKHAI